MEEAEGYEFLSCLRGSEQRFWCDLPSLDFLSCLRGSERWHARPPHFASFLSCLRGSEQDGALDDADKAISELPTRQ